MLRRIYPPGKCSINSKILSMKLKLVHNHYSSKKIHPASFTRAHRILHWMIAFTFLFILLTVWLRMNWMNKDHMAGLASASLKGRHIYLSHEDAIAVGRAIRRPMWNMHIYAGYLLIALYCVRLLVMKIEGPVFKNPFSRKITRLERFKSIIYLVFYICLGISLSKGAYINLIGKIYPAPYAVIKAVHIQSLYYALAFIFLHLAGLVIAELGSEGGIISRMVHGRAG